MMIKLARVQSVLIQIFGNDHPPPHIHVSNGNEVAVVEIDTGRVMAGTLSVRTLRIVGAWLTENRVEARAAFDQLNPPQH